MAKSTSASNGNSNQSVTVDDLSKQITVLKNDIASLTSTLGEYGKVKTNEAKKTAVNTVDELATAGKARALETQAQAEEFINAQPATALGIAAGIGFLIGMITARR